MKSNRKIRSVGSRARSKQSLTPTPPGDPSALTSAPKERFNTSYSAGSPLGRIVQVGHLPSNRGVERAHPRILKSYAFVYMYAGSGRYWDANGVDCPIGPGDLITLFPPLSHAYGPGPNETWSEIYAVFDGPVFDLWEQTGLLDPKRPVRRLSPVDYWVTRFRSVVETGPITGVWASIREVCRLQQILAEALMTRGQDKQASESQWTAKACAMLDPGAAASTPDLYTVASQLDMSYEAFRKQFRQLVGMSPAKYRARRTIDRACELIREGQLRHKQIATRLGFTDEYHFSRRFKEITGRSPRQFGKDLPGRE